MNNENVYEHEMMSLLCVVTNAKIEAYVTK